MSKPLTVRHQDEILSRYQVIRRGIVRVQCVRATEQLLKAAGIVEPEPFAFYEVHAKVIYGGTKLVLASDAAAGVPVEVPADAFDVGGFDEFGPVSQTQDARLGDSREEEPAGPADLDELRRVKESLKEPVKPGPRSMRVWEQTKVHALIEENGVRRVFEIPIRGEMKARVTVEVFEDDRLPSPGEPPKWVPCSKVENIEVWAAARALSEAREVTDFEISPGGCASAHVPAPEPSVRGLRVDATCTEPAPGPGVCTLCHGAGGYLSELPGPCPSCLKP